MVMPATVFRLYQQGLAAHRLAVRARTLRLNDAPLRALSQRRFTAGHDLSAQGRPAPDDGRCRRCHEAAVRPGICRFCADDLGL